MKAQHAADDKGMVVTPLMETQVEGGRRAGPLYASSRASLSDTNVFLAVIWANNAKAGFFQYCVSHHRAHATGERRITLLAQSLERAGPGLKTVSETLARSNVLIYTRILKGKHQCRTHQMVASTCRDYPTCGIEHNL